MKITCPECEAVLKSNVDLPEGKQIKCPKCGSTFAVPGPDEAVTAPSAAPRKAARPRDEADDDDDYDDAPPPRRKKKKGKQSGATMVIASVVVGLLVLLGAAAAGGYYFYAKYLREDAAAVVGENYKVVGPMKGAKGRGMIPPVNNPPPVAAGPSRGQPAPEIEGEDIDGKRFKLSDYRGKVVVLDFWGNW